MKVTRFDATNRNLRQRGTIMKGGTSASLNIPAAKLQAQKEGYVLRDKKDHVQLWK